MPTFSYNRKSAIPTLFIAIAMTFPLGAQEPIQQTTELLPAPPAIAPGKDVPEDVGDGDVQGQSTPQVLTFDRAQTSLIQNTFIATPVSGVVDLIAVAEGQMVQAENVLVHLQSDLAEKELVVARAALDAANLESENDVDLRYAKRTLEVRENEMQQSKLANLTYAGAVSKMELQNLGLQVDQAALAMEQAEHKLMIAAASAVEKAAAVAIAQTQLDRHTVKTAVSGLVVEIDVELGEWVEAGQPLVRIVSLDPIRVECFIDGRAHGQELVGRLAEFRPDGKGEPLAGTVTFVSPELHPVTGQVRVWATLENPNDRVGSGTNGTLSVK